MLLLHTYSHSELTEKSLCVEHFLPSFLLPHTSDFFLHFCDNCKSKLQQLITSSDVCTDVLQDILGSFIKGKPGLVDMNSADGLQAKFHSLEQRCMGSTSTGFYEWFMETKLSVVECSTLKSVQ